MDLVRMALLNDNSFLHVRHSFERWGFSRSFVVVGGGLAKGGRLENPLPGRVRLVLLPAGRWPGVGIRGAPGDHR